jgi:D-alanyl-D-alanine carboxypeptidase
MPPTMPAVKIPYLGTTLPPEPVMIRYFGPLADPSREITIMFAGHPVTINRILAGNLAAAGHAVTVAGLAGEIRDIGGFRTSVGASGSPIPFSMHQFGAAFDINEDGGPNGDWHTMQLDPRLVSLLASFHWFCGENWGGASRDGGHFQFTGGTRVIPVTGGGPGGPAPVSQSHPPLVIAAAVAAMYVGAGLLAAGVLAGLAAGAVWAAGRARRQ